MLSTPLGGSRLLAAPDGDRLHLLNATAAALWDRHARGEAARGLAIWLARTFGLPAAMARQDIAHLLESWRQAGLLDGPAVAGTPLGSAEWVLPVPRATACSGSALPLTLAGVAFDLHSTDAELARGLATLLQPLHRARCLAPSAHALLLSGAPGQWTLRVNGQPAAQCGTADAALTTVLHTLIDLACRAEDRLLVIHGAGLVMADGRGLLLVAPGGSGKTTLATALNAEGLGLLSDDVVPVNREGTLLGLGTPLCLKPGSWPVLTGHRPDLPAAPTLQRWGQTIRYLPPLGPPPATPIPPGLLLFPRYQPGAGARLSAMTPEAALQGIVEAEAVIRNLSQSKLDRLACWISAVPAYALTYPDLASGLALVRQAGVTVGFSQRLAPADHSVAG